MTSKWTNTLDPAGQVTSSQRECGRYSVRPWFSPEAPTELRWAASYTVNDADGRRITGVHFQQAGAKTQ
jgi:hypothetical protein